jgi:hypothetical protein
MAELSALRERLKAIEVLREENHALKHGAASADELRETVVRLKAEVEAGRMCGARSVVCLSLSLVFVFPVRTLTPHRWYQGEKCGVRDTHRGPLSRFTQSLSALHRKHAHRLEEHSADRAALRQREAEPADAQAREVDARATAYAPLQAIRAAEDRRTRALRIAALC